MPRTSVGDHLSPMVTNGHQRGRKASFGMPGATGSQTWDRGYPLLGWKTCCYDSGGEGNPSRKLSRPEGQEIQGNQGFPLSPRAVQWLFTGAYYLLTPLTTRSYPAHTPLTSVASACHECVMSVFGEYDEPMDLIKSAEFLVKPKAALQGGQPCALGTSERVLVLTPSHPAFQVET
jgi:hypothetical protein